MLTGASETRKSLIRPLQNNDCKEAAGCQNRVVRSCYIHAPGSQQEPRYNGGNTLPWLDHHEGLRPLPRKAMEYGLASTWRYVASVRQARAHPRLGVVSQVISS